MRKEIKIKLFNATILNFDAPPSVSDVRDFNVFDKNF